MYVPSPHKQPDYEQQLQLIRDYPLGILISMGESFQATHIPVVVSVDSNGNTILRAHIARGNKQSKDLENCDPNKEFLFIFQGPEAYVSPLYYTYTQPLTGKVAPTWDYAALHCYGTVKLIRDLDWLHQQVTDVTNEQEARHCPVHQWKVDDAPEQFVHLRKKAIFGVEFTVTRTEASWKYSQEAKPGDQQGVLKAFQDQHTAHGDLMAHMVEESLKQIAK